MLCRNLIVLIGFILFLSTQSVLAQTFKIATLAPDNSDWLNKLKLAALSIKTQTNNRVKIKFYPGGVMGDDQTVLRKMRLGQLHGAAVTNGSLNKFYPDIQVYNLAMKFTSLSEVDYVRSKMDKKLMQGLAKSRVVPMGFSEMGFAYLMSKGNPQNIADLRKYKTWIPEGNPLAETTMDTFNVPAIPLPIRDVLVGLQTGMIDTVAASPVGALTLQWHNHVQYVLDMPLSYVFGVLILDKKSLNRLSGTDRQVVQNELAKVMSELDRKNRKDNTAALQALYKQGIKKIIMNAKAKSEFGSLVSVANKKIISSSKISSASVNELNTYLKEYRSVSKTNIN